MTRLRPLRQTGLRLAPSCGVLLAASLPTFAARAAPAQPPSAVTVRAVVTGTPAPPYHLPSAAPTPAAPDARSDHQAGALSADSLSPDTVDAQADLNLSERLKAHGANPSVHSDILIRMAWNPNETDTAMKAAALRRLKQTDPRIVANSIISTIGSASSAARVGMLSLMEELYRGLGGAHSSLDVLLSEQIRSLDPDVAKVAMITCSQLGIREAYFPLREVASRPQAALRDEAIRALARLSDPRAVPFFKKLLDENSAPREEVYRALARLGRPSAIVLKAKLDDPDPAERRRALDALMPIATADDLSALYVYIQKYPPDGELKTLIYDVIATLEAHEFERPLGTGD